MKACQDAGKIVTVSIGGGDGSVVLSSDDDAKKFGEMIYDTFLGGKGQQRPFGDIVLDGYVPCRPSRLLKVTDLFFAAWTLTSREGRPHISQRSPTICGNTRSNKEMTGSTI